MKATFIVLLIDTATSATVIAAGAATGAGDGAGVGIGVGALGVLPPPHAIATAVMATTTRRFVWSEIEADATFVPRESCLGEKPAERGWLSC
jgi:hypothetical protein